MKDKLDTKIITDINGALENVSDQLEYGLNKEAEIINLKIQLEEALNQLKISNDLLIKTTSKYTAVFENSSQAYLIVSSGLFINEFNKVADKTCCELLNKNLKVGNSITEYFPPDIYSELYTYFNQAIKGETIISEFSMEDCWGKSMWFQIHFSPLINDHNEIASVLLSVMNVSAHANRSIAILESITDGMFALDKDWRFTYINAKAELMIKRKRKDLIGKNIWQVFKINKQNAFYRQYQRAVNEKKDIYFEEFSYFMGGWIEVHAYPSKEGLSVYFRSINQRKEAEERQKESEEWFKAVLATSRDGIAVELNQKLIYLNGAYLELFGYDTRDNEKIKNSNVSMFYAEEAMENMFELAKKRMNGEPVASVYETKGRKKDGTIIDIEVSASVLRMHSQDYIIVLVRDITQRKLSEIQLIAQNEELLKINSELDRFVYSASHDLRAPLMSILGLINIAKLESDKNLNHEYLNLMTKSINKLDRFVQDIIDYSRNSRIDVNSEEIDFKILIRENLDEMKFMENADKIESIIQINQEIPFFNDKNRLNIVLNNLISNAIRYSNLLQERPYIKISISSDASQAIIEVEDNGQGISELHINRIFEMFFRASEKNVGSGLGLYIVKETIVKLDGEIEVKSIYGKGTTFVIKIPNYHHGRTFSSC